MGADFEIKGLYYPSFYIKDYEEAVAFYTQIFGPPDVDRGRIMGWYLGNTWLTLFPSQDMGRDPHNNPRNAEFAVQVAEPRQVDLLYQAFLDAGAQPCMAPEDSKMYVEMRFSCVDDPFGIRIDIICPLAE